MKWDGMAGRNYDYQDGDIFKWKNRNIAELKHEVSDKCSYWHILIHDLGERDMFLGYDKDLPQKLLDDICEVFYSAIVIGLVYNQKVEDAALGSIPVIASSKG